MVLVWSGCISWEINSFPLVIVTSGVAFCHFQAQSSETVDNNVTIQTSLQAIEII